MVQAHVYPPLGAVTAVREATIAFRAYFVRLAPEDPRVGEAELWTDMLGNGWRGVALAETGSACCDGNHSGAPELALLDLACLGPTACIQQFGLDVDAAAAVSRRFEFTVRWRQVAGSGDWQWAAGFEHNACVVVYHPLPSPRGAPLNYWRQQLRQLVLGPGSPDGRSGPTPVAESWVVSPAGASCLLRPCDPDTSSGRRPLCRLAGVDRHLAFVRSDECWIAPRCGGSAIDTGDQEVLVLLAELSSGAFAALMPFARGDAAGGAPVLRFESPNHVRLLPPPATTDPAAVRVAVGIHQDPHCAVADAMARVQNQCVAQHEPPVAYASGRSAAAAAAHPCALPRHLGYCTWNAFYQSVNHDQLVSTLSDMRRTGARSGQPLPAWVIIDDGWQAVDAHGGHGRLRDMCADEGKFPGQLAHTVEALSELGIRRVGVWHALWGYWGGIDPAGPLAHQYELVACHRRRSLAADRESDVVLISPRSVHAFYDAFYAWLREQGVTFVKVDYQGAFEALDSYADCSPQDAAAAIADMRAAYYDAVESAALRHFGPGSIIYCMAQSPFVVARTLYRQGLQRQQPQQQLVTAEATLPAVDRMVLRNSDDYIPDVPSHHGWHIFCNIANTVWSHSLGDYFSTDWDMFRPGQPESRLHAAARALSGGMVYVTATAAEFESADLREVAGDDASVLPHMPPRLDSRCLFTDMTKVPAILVSSVAIPKASAVIAALFNVSSGTVVAPVSLCGMYAEAMGRLKHRLPQSTIAAAPPFLVAPGSSLAPADGLASECYAVHQHSTGRVHIAATAGAAPAFVLGLQSLACDAVTVAKMAVIRSADRSAILYAACVGDTSRYGGVAAVERSVYGVLSRGVPGSPCPSPPPTPQAQRQWHVRTRVAASSRQIAFAFSSREAVAEGRQLPITVHNVRVSSSSNSNSSNSADWCFDDETGALAVELNPDTTATAPPTVYITVLLSA